MGRKGGKSNKESVLSDWRWAYLVTEETFTDALIVFISLTLFFFFCVCVCLQGLICPVSSFLHACNSFLPCASSLFSTAAQSAPFQN